MLKFTTHTGGVIAAETEVTLRKGVNGEKSIKGKIYSNPEVINKIDKGWSIEFQNETYYVIYAKAQEDGEYVTVEFDAIHEFFYKMNKSSVYRQLKDGSHTAVEYLNFIFSGSPYSYRLEVSISAFKKESFGLKTRMTLFTDFVESTGVEYELSGKTVVIKKKIGTDLSTIVRKGLNLQDVGIEYNIDGFVTYARGFGAYVDENDHSKGRYQATYKSPLADVYGVLESEPVVDERYTNTGALSQRLKDLVENSYTVALTLSMADLNDTPYAQKTPNSGDYITLFDETLGLRKKVRVMSIDTKYSIDGVAYDSDLSLDSVGSVSRSSAQSAKTENTLKEIVSGNKKIPSSWLSSTVVTGGEAIESSQSELQYSTDGIVAFGKTNPELAVKFSSNGIETSDNGGTRYQPAVTGKGVPTDALFGVLDINQTAILGNRFHWTNDGLSVAGVEEYLTFGSYQNEDINEGKMMIALKLTTDDIGIAIGSTGVWVFNGEEVNKLV